MRWLRCKKSFNDWVNKNLDGYVKRKSKTMPGCLQESLGQGGRSRSRRSLAHCKKYAMVWELSPAWRRTILNGFAFARIPPNVAHAIIHSTFNMLQV